MKTFLPSRSPAGTTENSPPFQRRGTRSHKHQSPAGAAEKGWAMPNLLAEVCSSLDAAMHVGRKSLADACCAVAPQRRRMNGPALWNLLRPGTGALLCLFAATLAFAPLLCAGQTTQPASTDL